MELQILLHFFLKNLKNRSSVPILVFLNQILKGVDFLDSKK